MRIRRLLRYEGFGITRPGDVWSTAQRTSTVVLDIFRPATIGVFVAAIATTECLRRNILGPARFVVGAALITCAATVVSKELVTRSDPHGWLRLSGGSFPSGHVVVIIVGLRVAVLLTDPEPSRTNWALPTAGGLMMGTSLLVSGTHWATDVIGGAVLAIAIRSSLPTMSWQSKSR